MIRSRTRTRRTDTPSPRRLAISGVVTLAVIGLIVLIGTTASNGIPGRSYKTYFAQLPDIGNLKIHDDVRVAGVRVGQVRRAETRAGKARLELQLDGDVGELPVDTTATVRARGLLGTRYLELRPGASSRMLHTGATVQPSSLPMTNGVPDVLETFDKQTRGAFGVSVGELGQSVLGRGDDLNAAIGAAPKGLGAPLKLVSDAVLARPAAARALVPSLRSGLAAFDSGRYDIASGFGPAADGLQPFVTRRDAVQSVLEEAPGTLDAVTAGLEPGRRLLVAARHLSVSASRTLPPAPAGLRALDTLLVTSKKPLASATSLLHTVRPAVPDILRFTDALRPTLKPLQTLFDDAGPIVGELGRYGCDVSSMLSNWRSVLGFGSPANNPTGFGGTLGPLNDFRITFIAGPTSVDGVAPTPSKAFTDREVYPAPCRNSVPKPTFTALGQRIGVSAP